MNEQNEVRELLDDPILSDDEIPKETIGEAEKKETRRCQGAETRRGERIPETILGKGFHRSGLPAAGRKNHLGLDFDEMTSSMSLPSFLGTLLPLWVTFPSTFRPSAPI